MKKTIRIAGITVFMLAVFLMKPVLAHAALLQLDPATKSSPVDTTFDVSVNIDTEGVAATSTDVSLTYDNTILEVTQIKPGIAGSNAFFPELYQNITTNEIYIGSSVSNPSDSKTGAGTVATITFRGKIPGVTDITFNCTAGKTSDTNVSQNDNNATDMVDCTKLVNGRYTIGSGIGPTATPYPTNVAQPTRAPSPTMPATGSIGTTFGILGGGSLLLLLGMVVAFVL